jgi:hypothetical protein
VLKTQENALEAKIATLVQPAVIVKTVQKMEAHVGFVQRNNR